MLKNLMKFIIFMLLLQLSTLQSAILENELMVFYNVTTRYLCIISGTICPDIHTNYGLDEEYNFPGEIIPNNNRICFYLKKCYTIIDKNLFYDANLVYRNKNIYGEFDGLVPLFKNLINFPEYIEIAKFFVAPYNDTLMVQFLFTSNRGFLEITYPFEYGPDGSFIRSISSIFSRPECVSKKLTLDLNEFNKHQKIECDSSNEYYIKCNSTLKLTIGYELREKFINTFKMTTCEVDLEILENNDFENKGNLTAKFQYFNNGQFFDLNINKITKNDNIMLSTPGIIASGPDIEIIFCGMKEHEKLKGIYRVVGYRFKNRFYLYQNCK